MNANIVIPENQVVLHLSQTCKFMIFVIFFYYSSIVSASFNKITVFYRDRIIENDHKYILNGNKYIASNYKNVLTMF